MKKLLLFLLVCPLLFTACIKVEDKVVIHNDNSADVSNTFLMDKRLATAGGGNIFDEKISEMKKTDGVVVEKIDEGDYTGVKVTNKIKNIETDDIKPVANDIKLLNKDGRVVSIDKGFFTSAYTINMDYDMTKMQNSQGMTHDQASQYMKADFVLQTPTKAKENNATSVNEDTNTYTWDLKLFSSNPIKISFIKYNIVNITVTAVLVLFLLFLLPNLFIKRDKD